MQTYTRVSVVSRVLSGALGGLICAAMSLQAADLDIADTVLGIGTNAGYATPATWQNGVAPTSTDDIKIVNINGEKQINIPASVSTVINSISYNETDTVMFTGASSATPLPYLYITTTLTKDGSGTLYFASKGGGGPLSVYVADIDVKAGTLGIGSNTIGATAFKGINSLTVTGTTKIASGAILNIVTAYPNGGDSGRSMGATTNNGTLNISMPGSASANSTFRFNGLNGTNTAATMNTGAAASALTTTVQFTQLAGNSATYAGSIGEGALNKVNLDVVGGGIQVLTGATNYTGTTRISNSGLLVFSGSSSFGGTAHSQTSLSGGTLANGGSIIGLGNGDLTTWGVGAGVNNIAMNGAAGFAAFGGDRTVSLTNGALTWGFAGFVAAQGSNPGILVLGHSTATGKVTMTNDIALDGATRTFVAHDGSSAIDGSLTGVISSASGGIVKEGAGTLELKGNNTYVGDTVVSAGTLLVNNLSGSGTGSGMVSIAAGAGLGGKGTISGLVYTVGATAVLGAGNSPGTLTLTTGLDANSGAIFDMQLGTLSDRIDMGSFVGSASDDGLVFNFSDAGGLSAGVAYTLLNFASVSDLSYEDLFANSVAAGFALDTAFGTDGFLINGNNLQVQFVAVPEPSTWMLLGSGLLFAWIFRRRAGSFCSARGRK